MCKFTERIGVDNQSVSKSSPSSIGIQIGRSLRMKNIAMSIVKQYSKDKVFS